ncbi:MAG: ABC transporter ATP-binding protein [Candidatus Bathyarchaeia archaeon]
MSLGEIILQTQGLTRRFDGLTAVDHVNFAMDDRELRGVIGPNGAGKTTFVNLLTGRISPTSGRILFRGADITRFPIHARARLGIAYIFQLSNLFPQLTVYENVRLAAQSFSNKRGNVFIHHSSLVDVNQKAEEALKTMDLLSYADMKAAELSHGLAKRLEVALALAMDASLLLMDEPTQGLAVKEASETAGLIKQLAKEKTVLLVEHDLNVVMRIADRISVFHEGRIIAEGPPAEITANETVRNVYLGTFKGP